MTENITFERNVSLFTAASAQNCYVCHDQETNDGKCATTVEECDYGQDHCLSEVGWGSKCTYSDDSLFIAEKF